MNFQTLRAQGQSAATVVKLMMACNDLSLANQALSEWKEQPNSGKQRQAGALMYFVRIQLGHLCEGLKVIRSIRNDPSLMRLVEQCDQITQQLFCALEDYLKGGSKYSEFQRLIGQIRHQLIFHYDESGKLIEKAISDRSLHPEIQTSSVTRGDTAYLWHFKVADDLVNSIVTHQIWAIPRGSDVRAEADKVADQVHQIFLSFVDFSGEFIWRYCAR